MTLCAAAMAEPLTLTLDQAVERALKTDPRIAERQRLVDVAQGLLAEVNGNEGWKFDANTFLAVSPGVNGNIFRGGACAPGNCALRTDRYDLGNNGLSPWVNLQMSILKPLSTFGKIEHYASAARANIEVKEGDVRTQRAATILDVKRAYYGHLAAHDARLFLEDVRKGITKTIGIAEEWLENGEGEGDIRQADLYALRAARSLVGGYITQAEGMEKVAIEGLKVLTGIPAEERMTLAGSGLSPVPLPEGALPALQEQALAKRPEMAQVEAGLRARRSLVEARRAERLPNLYAGVAGILSYSPNRDNLKNPYIYDPFNTIGLTPMIGLKWDWQPRVQDAKLAQESAELNALLAKSDLARQGIPFQVAEQYHQVQADHTKVQQLGEGSRNARRWMIARYADFEAGMEIAERVINAFQGYVLIHTDYIRAIYDYNMRVAQLHSVTGTEE
ncbi:MAG: TolC family protein [Gammaproteobacteria bacterium]|nr:TolC family protein [Gammaproteobacteria bacterium]